VLAGIGVFLIAERIADEPTHRPSTERCGVLSLYEAIIFLTFVSYAVVLALLRRKINRIEKVEVSGLDRKINHQYNRIMSKLRLIITFNILCKLLESVYGIMALLIVK